MEFEPILNADYGAYYTPKRLLLEEMPKPGDRFQINFFSGEQIEDLKVVEVDANLRRVYLEREPSEF